MIKIVVYVILWAGFPARFITAVWWVGTCYLPFGESRKALNHSYGLFLRLVYVARLNRKVKNKIIHYDMPPVTVVVPFDSIA